VSAVSVFECSRSKQLEMKTAGNSLCGLLCEPRLLNMWNSDSAIRMRVIKTGCNVSCC
jgi:hypothetical protein